MKFLYKHEFKLIQLIFLGSLLCLISLCEMFVGVLNYLLPLFHCYNLFLPVWGSVLGFLADLVAKEPLSATRVDDRLLGL